METENNKKYSSFEEIQHDLEVLKIQRQLAYNNIKKELGELKSNLSFQALTGEVLHLAEKKAKVLLSVKLTKIIIKMILNFFKKNSDS